MIPLPLVIVQSEHSSRSSFRNLLFAFALRGRLGTYRLVFPTYPQSESPPEVGDEDSLTLVRHPA
jgi:hypothetical protein